MKTIELDASLEAQLEAVRRLTGQDEVEIIRDGVAARWEQLRATNGETHVGDGEDVTDDRPITERWAHIIGAVRSTDGVSHMGRNSEAVFAEVMEEKEARIMGRTRSEELEKE